MVCKENLCFGCLRTAIETETAEESIHVVFAREKTRPVRIQTLLGWSVVGYSDHSDSDVPVINHRTSVKELHNYTPRDVIKVLEKDFAHYRNENVKISQEDIAFLNCMEQDIHWKEDKHFEMPLPFKGRPILPNNKTLALIRLDHLKRKLRQEQT